MFADNPAAESANPDAGALLWELAENTVGARTVMQSQLFMTGGMYSFHYEDLSVTLFMSQAEFTTRRRAIRSKYANFAGDKRAEGDRLKQELAAERGKVQDGQHFTVALGGTVLAGTDNDLVCANILALIEIGEMPPSGEYYGIMESLVRTDRNGRSNTTTTEIY